MSAASPSPPLPPFQWNYDSTTVEYFLLLQQKNRGEEPHFVVPKPKYVYQLNVALNAVLYGATCSYIFMYVCTLCMCIRTCVVVYADGLRFPSPSWPL